MSDERPEFQLETLTLGQPTEYSTHYDSGLLQPVPRSLSRREIKLAGDLPFRGADIWNAYELSWLNARGKPIVALARFGFDCTTPNIIESKSFKLYLNSFNQTHFESREAVQATLQKDLSRAAGGTASVALYSPQDNSSFSNTDLPGTCLDDLDIEVAHYRLRPDALVASKDNEIVHETLHSHLLKSNCLITNQPDWASIVIDYRGAKMDHAALLRYLVSFRLHNEFHEQCVERIFMDIQTRCHPLELSIQALYTRRGGLDINPYRTSGNANRPPQYRINRQ